MNSSMNSLFHLKDNRHYVWDTSNFFTLTKRMCWKFFFQLLYIFLVLAPIYILVNFFVYNRPRFSILEQSHFLRKSIWNHKANIFCFDLGIRFITETKIKYEIQDFVFTPNWVEIKKLFIYLIEKKNQMTSNKKK